MACVFLDGPLLLRSLKSTTRARTVGGEFFQPSGRAAQAHTQVRLQLHGKGNFKFPIKPSQELAHEHTIPRIVKPMGL
jgi:hypothetical protein